MFGVNMKKNNSNVLIHGLIIGGLIGAGLTIYYSSRFISKSKKQKRERKHKFYEGIDDIFDASDQNKSEDDSRIDKETEKGIIDELFSRSN
jgi:esterase/lipase